MNENKEKYRIFAEDDPELGKFIEGYDSRKDSGSRNGCLLVLGLMLIVLGVYALGSITSKGNPAGGIFALLFFGGIGCILMFMGANPQFNYVTIYEKGFIWEIINTKGEKVSSKRVLFDDVTSIFFSKDYQKGKSYISPFNRIYMDFQVLGKGGIIIHKKGNNRCTTPNSDESGWMYFSLVAIEKQWKKHEQPLQKEAEETPTAP